MDFVGKIKKMGLDTYQRMKLVNYIRKQTFDGVCWICQQQVGNPTQLAKHFAEEETPLKVWLFTRMCSVCRTFLTLSCGTRRSI